MPRFSLALGLVFAAFSFRDVAHAANAQANEERQTMVMEFFAGSCLDTFPNHSGLGQILSRKGFVQNAEDGTWKNEVFFVNPNVGTKGACLVGLSSTNPKGIAERLGQTLQHHGAQNVKITVRGRKTEASFVKDGIAAKVNVHPLSSGSHNQPVTLISIAKSN